MSSNMFSSAQPNPEVPEVLDVSVEEVNEKTSQIKLVDVRQPTEYTGELGHIRGAELIPLDQLEGKIDSLPTDQHIVFICRSGKRSVTASMIAQQHGFETVYNMAGGMIQWNEAGLDIEQ